MSAHPEAPDFTAMERDAALAGLRILQLAVEGQIPWPAGGARSMLQEIYTNSGAHPGLDTGDIDALCERINTTPGSVAPTSLEHAELATLRAALRHYLDSGLGDPSERTDDVHELATDCHLVTSLDDDGIDALDAKLCDLMRPMQSEPETSLQDSSPRAPR